MRIAFDFHGVNEKYPDILQPIMETLSEDHFITILSGPPYEEIVKELKHMKYVKGLHYDEIISVVDWIKKQGVEMSLNKNSSWCCEDEIWWSSKAQICREQFISILVDDKLEYKEHIKDNYPLFFHVT